MFGKGEFLLRIFTVDRHIPQGSISASEKDIQQTADLLAYAHAHEFFEMELFLSGEGVNIVNGVSHPIQPGMLFLLTPAHIHSVYSKEAHLINVMFLGDTANALTELSLQDTPVFRLTEEESAFLQTLLREIVAVHETDAAYASHLLHCALEKLARSQQSVRSDATPLVQQAMVYMLENFRTDLTAEQVAHHVGLSRAYFSDLFRRETHVSFKEYLDSLRFSYACTQLAFSSQPVHLIAESAGFGDYANFARRFKARFNCTPREWRKRN